MRGDVVDLHKGEGPGRPRRVAAAASVVKSDARYMAQQRAAFWVDVMGVGLNAVWPGHHAQLGLPNSLCLSPAVSCLSSLSLPPLFTSFYILLLCFSQTGCHLCAYLSLVFGTSVA